MNCATRCRSIWTSSWMKAPPSWTRLPNPSLTGTVKQLYAALDDLNQVAEDAKERIEDRFGTAEETSETGEITEAEDAPAPVPAEPADAPVAGEPING